MHPAPHRPVPVPRGGSFDDPASFDVGVHENSVLGKLIDGRYRVTGLLAKGGMAKVFRAEQVAMRRRVAIKVVDTSGDRDVDREFRARFLREVDACSRLSHPNTVRVYDHGTWERDQLYLVMEYIQGRTLHEVLRAGPMPGSRVLGVARQAAMALREAHAHGLVHRDIKPANIMLADEGDGLDFVKVLDFGLVKNVELDDGLTGIDGVAGSPSYMSPEQIRGEGIDHRSDIYSLGVVLYNCVKGQPPFTWTNAVGVLWGHLNEPVPPLPATLPALCDYPGLGPVIERCLAKSPGDRFQTMDELLVALREVEQVDEIVALSPSDIDTMELPVEPATRPFPTPTPARRASLPAWFLPLLLSATLGALASGVAVLGFLIGMGLRAGAEFAQRPLADLPLSTNVFR